jgi:uncharacterized iron-regulated membrane protein
MVHGQRRGLRLQDFALNVGEFHMDAVASPAREKAKKIRKGGISWNRTIHRVGALLVVLLTLWLGTTGVSMQLLDLHAIFTHAPPTDPIEVSMAEGRYGPANYAVIQLSDFSAPALPKGFDIRHAMGTVLQAAQANGGGPTSWIELRVADGMPIGQVMSGTKLQAFNAQTGQPVTAVPPQSIPQGARLPPSLRQKLKTLHRFWNRGDTPGVYFEFLAGLVLWTLLITGLVMYFRLLSARARIGRRQLFWLTGGVWRGLHRAISVLAAVFLLCIAFSGTWIGFESSWSALRRGGGGPPPVTVAGQPGQRGQSGPPGQPGQPRQPGVGGGGRRNQATPVRDADVDRMTTTTLDAMQRLHPDTPIKAIRLRTYGQMKQGVVIAGGENTDQLVFNAENGQPASLTEAGYPPSGFPFGVQVHENIKHFHSGDMFGVPARLMNLFAGVSLLFLSISGLTMYFDMWLKRRKGGRGSLIWR